MPKKKRPAVKLRLNMVLGEEVAQRIWSVQHYNSKATRSDVVRTAIRVLDDILRAQRRGGGVYFRDSASKKHELKKWEVFL